LLRATLDNRPGFFRYRHLSRWDKRACISRSAHPTDTIYTIIETAKLNVLEPKA
jgi:hypothetical protein